MSSTFMPAAIGDAARWHDPANDCPNRAAFLDQLLGRKAAAVEPAPEPRKCARPGCMVALRDDKRASALYCSHECGWNHRKSMKGGARTRQKLKGRKTAPMLLAEAMALPADAELSREHRHVLAGAFVDGFAEAVGVGA